ncbi:MULTISPECIES: hypothetical protein [Spirulina sp. CCY15215]|uniref:type II toxin-antitoxin system RelN family antitoxin n=1 Tax=Spirulina sp. CCY15215 TaxID=2767591 RepID=UPI0019523D9C|nr:hypothetical protein [Spirulina major]
MQAFEVIGTVNENGELVLRDRLAIATDISIPCQVKVIVIVPNEPDLESDDTPVEEIKASLRQALREAKEGKRIPLDQMWEGIDAEEILSCQY